MEWFDAVDEITPHIVKILTPNSMGTGWLCSRSTTTSICAIATAAHVVDHAHTWELPIRLYFPGENKTHLLRAPDRAVNLERNLDTATIIFNANGLPLPENTIPLVERDNYYKQGVEIGWLGFPGIVDSGPCFFSGRVSSFEEARKRYLMDGVAIHGVSGGPAFRKTENGLDVVGVLSAYIANRATGETLPGLAVIQDVTQFHDEAERFRSVDAAKQQESKPSPAPIPPEPEFQRPQIQDLPDSE